MCTSRSYKSQPPTDNASLSTHTLPPVSHFIPLYSHRGSARDSESQPAGLQTGCEAMMGGENKPARRRWESLIYLIDDSLHRSPAIDGTWPPWTAPGVDIPLVASSSPIGIDCGAGCAPPASTLFKRRMPRPLSVWCQRSALCRTCGCDCWLPVTDRQRLQWMIWNCGVVLQHLVSTVIFEEFEKNQQHEVVKF